MKPSWEIRQGHVLEVLAGMESESVHEVVTSPPYWGLRDYGIEPQVWGGDADHEHEWSTLPTVKRGSPTASTLTSTQRLGLSKQATGRGDSCACGAWLGSLGLEPTLGAYLEHLVQVCREIWRVLRKDGTFWLNLGDAYTSGGRRTSKADSYGGPSAEARDSHHRMATPEGLKLKDLMGQPWRVAFALQDEGWILRSAIVWHKSNPMPESVTDRPTSAYEMMFLLAKQRRYFYDAEAVRVPWESGRDDMRVKGVRTGMAYLSNGKPRTDKQRRYGRLHAGFNDRWDGMSKAEQQANGANARNVWTMPTEPFPGAHFATFPKELPRRCILAGTSERGVCGECGAPWARQMQCGKNDAESHRQSYNASLGYSRKSGSTGVAPTQTMGWLPTCAHEGDPVPATVLDPFAGSGTTGLVALRHQRSFIGIELSPEYSAMARQRILDDQPLLNHQEGGEIDETRDGHRELPGDVQEVSEPIQRRAGVATHNNEPLLEGWET